MSDITDGPAPGFVRLHIEDHAGTPHAVKRFFDAPIVEVPVNPDGSFTTPDGVTHRLPQES